MKTENGLIAPTINLNGSSPEDLMRAYVSGIVRLQHAAADLKLSVPHGRDYQTTDPNELDDAITQHGRWMKAIATLIQEMTEVTSAIERQRLERERGGRA